MSEDSEEEAILETQKTYFQKLHWAIKLTYFITLALLIILLAEGKCDRYGLDITGKSVCLEKSFQLWLILPIIGLIILLIYFTQSLRPKNKLTDDDCLEKLDEFIRKRQARNLIPTDSTVTISPGTKPQWIDNEVDHRWYKVNVYDKIKKLSKDWVWYINVFDHEIGFELDKGKDTPHVVKEFKAETREDIEMKRKYNQALRGEEEQNKEGDE